MELGWGHYLRQEHEARSSKQEGGSPSRPSTPAAEPKLKQAQPFYWARLPALFFTPSPLLLELVPFFTSSTSLTPSNLSIHPSTRPFFELEKQSAKMGYTKTDELAINTIRVLAVSQESSQAFLPQRAATASLPLHRRYRRRR